MLVVSPLILSTVSTFNPGRGGHTAKQGEPMKDEEANEPHGKVSFDHAKRHNRNHTKYHPGRGETLSLSLFFSCHRFLIVLILSLHMVAPP
jgi:hypothetical protein